MQVPIANANCGYAVMHGATNAFIPCVTIPVSGATVCMQMLLATLDISTRAESADFEVYFQVSVPPLGYTTVLLSPAKPIPMAFETMNDEIAFAKRAMRARRSNGKPSKTVVPLPERSWEESCDICAAAHAFNQGSWEEQKLPDSGPWTRVANYMKRLTLGLSTKTLTKPTTTSNTPFRFHNNNNNDKPGISGDVVLENDHLKVLFNGMTGKIAAMQHKGTGQWLEVSLDLIYWESLTQVPYGGAYIMRPGAQVTFNFDIH